MEKKELERLVANEQQSKSNTKRIDNHGVRIDNLEKTYAIMEKMDYRMEKVESSVEKIDTKLDNRILEENKIKGNKWDKFIDYCFKTLLGIILGYIALKLGLG